MKLLLISDEEEKYLWDYYQPGRLEGIDMILSAGDLKAEYLSFLVTMTNRPLLYVHGNHDEPYDKNPPEGCECIDDKLVTVNGLRILGLGGCPKYNAGKYQYTEQQMERRIRRLRLALLRAGGVDIVLTHAPPENLGDWDDNAHKGFAAFLPLLEKYHPAYLIHGHVHTRYRPKAERILEHNGTKIINACGRYILEIDNPEQ